jgi:hypothetical protein
VSSEVGKSYTVITSQQGLGLNSAKIGFWTAAEQRSSSLVPGKAPIAMASPHRMANAIAGVIEKPKGQVFITRFEPMLPVLRGAYPGALERYSRKRMTASRRKASFRFEPSAILPVARPAPAS